jgi:hypothetical protein
MLALLSKRLQEATNKFDLPFGGIPIMLVGDFSQLPPVKGMSLPRGLISAELYERNLSKEQERRHRVAAKRRRTNSHSKPELPTGTTTKVKPTKLSKYNHTTLFRQGCELIRKCELMKLTDQEQAKHADPRHMELLEKMEMGEMVQLSDIQHYDVLKPEDFTGPDAADWLSAPILVATNRERHNLIHSQCRRFARAKGCHVIRWPVQSKQWEQKPRLPQHVEQAMDDPCFWEYYVPEADGFLTDNANKSQRLANGTRIRYHSIVPLNQNQTDQIKAQTESLPIGSVITLSELPLAINVILVDEESGKNEKTKKSNIARWKSHTLVKDRVVVPILPQRYKKNPWDKTIVSGGDGFLPSRVKIRAHFPIEPAFAITIHKAQGRTINKVILAISQRLVAKCNMSYASLYVALSRVKRATDIRLLLHGYSWDSVKYVSTLEPDKCIKAFFAGFKRDASQWNADDALSEYDALAA